MTEEKNKKTAAPAGEEEQDMPEITVDQLIDRLAALQADAQKERDRADEMTNVATRLRADFDNYRKRTNETNKRVREDGAVDVIVRIIPVLDTVRQALTMIEDPKVREGVDMIKAQLDALLTAFDVTEIVAEDDFDPKCHEAIAQVEQAGMSGKITEVFQVGYRLGDRIIRPARVIVGK